MSATIENHWLFGYFKPFVSHRVETLRHISTLGDVTRFRLLMGVNYMVSDPQLIAQVLLDPENIFIKNRGFWSRFDDIFGQGLVISEGTIWKKHRKLMAPAFQSKTVQTYFSQMISEVDQYVCTWRTGECISVHQSMMEITLNVLNACLFNVEFADVKKQIVECIKQLESQFSLRVVRPFGFQSKWPSKINKDYWAALTKLETIVKQFINNVRAKNDDKTLLDKLVNARDEGSGGLDDNEIRDELITLILAGHDTTSITVSWALYLLSQHPHLIATLRMEWSTLDPQNLDYNSLVKLPLTRGVLRETLRLYPPAYIIGREPLVDTQIGGVKIPKSFAVVISPYAMGRDERFYKEPEKFIPQRWNEEFEKTLPRFAFIPFGGGKRTCIGEHFAMAEAAILLWRIIGKYDIEYTDNKPLQPAPVMTLTPAPFNLKVHAV
ncbi:MAG: cytochrome P450 [Anaerolineae bacterium]|nr:cytochrome P450 [Anaerolineae bacterium]